LIRAELSTEFLNRIQDLEEGFNAKVEALQLALDSGTNTGTVQLVQSRQVAPPVDPSLGKAIKELEGRVIRLETVQSRPPVAAKVALTVPKATAGPSTSIKVPKPVPVPSTTLSKRAQKRLRQAVAKKQRALKKANSGPMNDRGVVRVETASTPNVWTRIGPPRPKRPKSGNVLDNHLIGDSMVGRDFGHHYSKTLSSKSVKSLPGARLGRVITEVGKLRINKESSLIISAGGNDLFLRRGNPGDTEPIMKAYKDLIAKAMTKSNKVIIVGLIPRWKIPNEGTAHSKAIGINIRLNNLCKESEVKFIDPWDSFKKPKGLFAADGVHFSVAGGKRFHSLLKSNMYRAQVAPTPVRAPAAVERVPVVVREPEPMEQESEPVPLVEAPVPVAPSVATKRGRTDEEEEETEAKRLCPETLDTPIEEVVSSFVEGVRAASTPERRLSTGEVVEEVEEIFAQLDSSLAGEEADVDVESLEGGDTVVLEESVNPTPPTQPPGNASTSAEP
jgi:hypothetical protein